MQSCSKTSPLPLVLGQSAKSDIPSGHGMILISGFETPHDSNCCFAFPRNAAAMSSTPGTPRDQTWVSETVQTCQHLHPIPSSSRRRWMEANPLWLLLKGELPLVMR